MNDDQIDAQLRSAILAEPVSTASLDARLRHEMNRASIRRGKWIAALSVAAMVAMAIGGYRIVSNRDAAICNDAARDHRMEVEERGQRKWLTDPAAVASLAAARGLPSGPVNAIAPEGFRFEHGKLCRLGGQVFLHLVYVGMDDGGREVSIYLRKRDANASPVVSDRTGVAIESSRGVVAVAVTAGARIDAAALARRAAMMSS